MTQGSKEHSPKLRAVRSYVRRAGRITASQSRALEELWPIYGIEYGDTELDFTAVFGRDAARVLEIGYGNGESLVEVASLQADIDFIGVEVHDPGVGHCLIKAREAGIENLRLITHDALDVLEMQIPTASLTRINLYFPDPWPKKRHHKRRIVQSRFLNLSASRLQNGGTLHIATDWANYAEHIDEILQQYPQFECAERREHDGSLPLDRPQTKFERRGLKRGHRIWDWRYVYVE